MTIPKNYTSERDGTFWIAATDFMGIPQTVLGGH